MMEGKTRIALVDDDPGVRDATAAMLAREGYQVDRFDSGESFLEAVTDASCDIVLLDIRMPGMSGIDVLRELGSREIDTPVIILTGHGDVPLAVEAMKLGAVDFIEKPYSADLLFRAIREVLDGHRMVKARAGKACDHEDAIAALTQRQRDVLAGVAAGKANKVIAYELGLSTRTVEAYRARLFERLGVRSTAEAVRAAVSAGLV